MKTKNEQFALLKNQELVKACRIHGLPATPQRQAVLEALAMRTDHPSADELYDQAKQQLRGLSRTTVYRVLDTLVKIGVVQKVSTVEARARFDADTHRHPHILCIGCGKLCDLDDLSLQDLLPTFPQVEGFRLMNYSVQFTGFCNDCLATQEQTTRLAEPNLATTNKEKKR